MLVVWSLGSLLFVASFEIIRNWYLYFCIMLAIPSLVTAFLILFVKESAIFFLKRNDMGKVLQILGCPKSDLPCSFVQSEVPEPEPVEATNEDNMYRMKITVCCSTMMLGLQFIYYGSQFALQNSGLGPLINSLVLGMS
jgi:hypothetical protein